MIIDDQIPAPKTESRWAKFAPILFLLLTPLLPLWRAIFLGEAIGPFGQIHSLAPWHGPKPDRPFDVLQADGVLQFYGWRDLVLSAWSEGKLPFWNPYSLAGTPLLANGQSAALYPGHVILGLLHVPTALAIVLLAWFHLAWTAIGTYLLVRRLGGSAIGGMVAGASFGLSPFMIAWTGLPSVITTVSWIPWVLAFAVAVFNPAQTARIRQAVGLAVCVGMLILSGHLRFVAYGIMGLIVWMIVQWIVNRKTNGTPPWHLALGALLLGAMVAAPQLLPTLSYSQFSHRRAPATAEGYDHYTDSAVKPFELETLPFATLLGHPGHYADMQADAQGQVYSSYWPQLVKQGANYAESAISLGPLVLALLVLAPWRRQGKRFAALATLGAVALLLAMGTVLNKVLYFAVPGWSATGSPGRVEVLFVLAGCVLAGLALDKLPELPKTGLKRLLPILAPVGLSVLFVAIGMAAAPSMQDAIGQIRAGAFREAAPMLLIGVVVAAAAIASAYHLEKPANRAIVLVSPIILFVLAGGLDLVATGDPSFLKTTPIHPADPNERIAVVNAPWGIVSLAPALYPPNTLTDARLHDLAGYDSLMHRDTVKLLQDIDQNPKGPAPEANGNMMFVKPTADPKLLADAGVSEVWTLREMPQLGSPTGVENGVLRYALPGPGRASTPQGPAQIQSESPTQIVVNATGPGRLVLRDRNMPGWMVKIDGQHAPLEGTTWREVDLPAGAHKVEFNYVPPGFMTGVYAALVAILLLGALAWIREVYTLYEMPESESPTGVDSVGESTDPTEPRPNPA